MVDENASKDLIANQLFPAIKMELSHARRLLVLLWNSAQLHVQDKTCNVHLAQSNGDAAIQGHKLVPFAQAYKWRILKLASSCP